MAHDWDRWADCCAHSHESSDSVERGDWLDQSRARLYCVLFVVLHSGLELNGATVECYSTLQRNERVTLRDTTWCVQIRTARWEVVPRKWKSCWAHWIWPNYRFYDRIPFIIIPRWSFVVKNKFSFGIWVSKQRKSDRVGTWNVRSLYRAGSQRRRGLARYKLDVVSVQELRWDKGAQYEQGIIIFSTEKKTKIINWEQDFLYTTE